MSTPIPPGPKELDDPELAQVLGVRINSRDLFQHSKSVEIEHEGKVYQLRLTRLNKLILTA